MDIPPESPSEFVPSQKRETKKNNPLTVWAISFCCVFFLYISKILSSFCALPILFVTLRLGGVHGGMLLVFSTLLLSAINPIDASFLILSTGTASWVAGVMVHKGKGIPRAIFSGIVVVGILMASVFFVMKPLGLTKNVVWLAEYQAGVDSQVNRIFDEFDKMAQEKSEFPRTEEDREKERQFFHRWVFALLPGGVVSMSAVLLWVFFMILRRPATRWGFSDQYGQLSAWKNPDNLIWVLILTLLTLIFKVEMAKVPAVNVLIVVSTLYLFQGMAILAHYVKRRKFSPGLRLIFYMTVILLFKVLVFVLVVLGIFDIWFDFRKLKAGVT